MGFREQTRAFVVNEISHAFWSGGDDWRSGGECFNNRDRHVVEIRCVDEDVGLIVEAADFLARSYAHEVHTGQFQVGN